MSNDRLKFRVYLPDENRYLHTTDCPVIDSSGELMWCYLNPFGHWEHYPMENAVVEQCTGLRDCKGNLIYEGDIITTAFEYETPTEYDTCAVKWCRAYAGEMFCSVDERGEPVEFYGGIPLVESCRVIGNIHEIDTLRFMLPENDEEKEQSK